ncbi:hypothetical protein OUZ56_027997 [Daphnia magna]|uniref:Uncharacterized protein n=1 Tax=Daphnia magna TaxID=35525 RepID=A0ABR0B2J0_9CRUS|nr:hypothetical protein OUZ56_027997 [Daphnia magna]
MRDYDVMHLRFAFALSMATSAGTDGFVLIWTLDYTTPTPYYTTSYAAPSYSTKALEYYTTYAAPSYYTESPNYLVYYTTRTPKYYTTIYSAPTYYTQAIKYYAAQSSTEFLMELLDFENLLLRYVIVLAFSGILDY